MGSVCVQALGRNIPVHVSSILGDLPLACVMLAEWMLCLEPALAPSSSVRACVPLCPRATRLLRRCYLGSSFWGKVCQFRGPAGLPEMACLRVSLYRLYPVAPEQKRAVWTTQIN